MYSPGKIFSESNHSSRFFGLVDGLVAEHRALQIRFDGLMRENAELQRRLQEDVDKFDSGRKMLDTASTSSPFEIQLSCPPPPSTALSFPHFPGDAVIELEETPIPKRPEPRVSPEGQLRQLPSPDDSNDSSNSVELVADEEPQGSSTPPVRKSSAKMKVPREVAIQRLKARLGHISDEGLVTPQILLDAVNCLGLSKYGLEEITDIMHALKSHVSDHPPVHMADQAAGRKVDEAPEHQVEVSKQGSQNSKLKTVSSYFSSLVDTNQHRAIRVDGFRSLPEVAKSSRISFVRHLAIKMGMIEDEEDTWKNDENTYTIQFEDFANILTKDTQRHMWSKDVELKLTTIKEVLLSAETNRLVAELMHVRIDDLASPPAPPDFLQKIEPLVNFMIIANGVIVGVQTDAGANHQQFFTILEVTFVSFFTIEMFLRMYITGIRYHFFGNDCGWNIFDASVMGISYGDLTLTFLQKSLGGDISLSVVRLIRLTRLSRMLRMLRFKCFQELALMIKGLMGGFRTLVWATVLLIFAIYVIAVFSTALIGKTTGNLEPTIKVLFSKVGMSMFTGFRCFTGDCTDEAGNSIPLKLESYFGFPFALAYCTTTMMVTFGIFNIIIAIYIEKTLDAAKIQSLMDKKTRDRESLRVAHVTKRLLKKFCRAVRFFGKDVQDDRAHGIKMGKLLNDATHEEEDEIEDFDMTISKDLFLLVIQHKEVQALLDELDIPHDRASLFDVLDADGSGDLEVTELVHGFLKVRGDARKSDVVAGLLSIRAVQEQLRHVDAHVQDCHMKVNELFARRSIGGVAPLASLPDPSLSREMQAKPRYSLKPSL